MPSLKPFEFIILAHAILLLVVLKYTLRLRPEPYWGLEIGIPFLKVFLLCAGSMLVFRVLYLWIRKGRTAVDHYCRSLFRIAVAGDLLRLLFWINLMVFGHTWLKVFIPLINPSLYDSALYKFDNFVHLGINPNRFLIALFPYPWFLRFLDWEYSVYHSTIVGGFTWFFVACTRSERYRVTAAFCVLWLAGSWLYLAIPSLGPCYTLAEDYAKVTQSMPKIVEFQRLLIQHYFSIRRPERNTGIMAIPIFGVAAFPSLHVAVQFFLALWARRRNRLLFVGFILLTFFTFIASLLSGWHYAIDGYAAVAMAYVCARLFDKRRNVQGSRGDEEMRPHVQGL